MMASPFPDDFLFSDSAAAPPASPLVQEAGIGLTQPPAPVESRFVPEDPSGRRPEVDREQFLKSRSFIGRLALPFNERAARRRGQPTEFEKIQIDKQKARERQLQELQVFSDITNKTFAQAATLSGEERETYIALQSKVLNGFSPGSGELLKSLADDPEYGKLVMKNAEKSPTLRTAMEVGGLRKAMDLMKTTGGAKLVRTEIEGAELPEIRKKLQTLGMAAQELMSPERYQKMLADGFISPAEGAELNGVAAAHPKYKAAALTPEQLNLAARYEDATYAMAGFATSKTAQEALKKGPESTVGKIKADLKAGRITQKEADEAIEKANAPSGVNINLGAPIAGVDEAGKPVFFQQPKKGGKPEIVPGVKPRPTGNPLLDAVAEKIRNPEGKSQPTKAAKFKVGDTLTRGGKKWRVTGFDKDGEPLVEEVKSSTSGKIKR